ncbi:MAG: hypothetical protein CVU11_10660 [Bacteroidetes bacterium HGW-Bacteroidetes-6]|jgi:hypothetical protein|nr:MAG: hypothetical protein CVU11_10660 [Bacteroidetes bacterium HGW-Bacteroidetes-6]
MQPNLFLQFRLIVNGFREFLSLLIFPFTVVLLFSPSSIFAQQDNTFKIGVVGPDHTTTYNQNIWTGVKKPAPYNAFYSSAFGVFSEDGVNFERSYYPDLYISQDDFSNFITLLVNHNISLIDNNEGWFKAIPGNPSTGILVTPLGQNVYDMSSSYPTHVNNAIYNYDALYSNVYNLPTLQNNIFGHILAGESNYYHWIVHNEWPSVYPDFYSNPSGTINNYTFCEVPPRKLNSAFLHFQPLANSLNQYLLQVQAVHGCSISNSTTDAEGIYSVSEYLKIGNRGNVFIEGSYFQKQWEIWYQPTFPSHIDYLGKFKSIDYSKQYYEYILAEIDVSYLDGQDYMWLSNPNIKNANHLWFQTYTSIIHGVSGVLFWGIYDSYNTTLQTDINAKNAFNVNVVSNNNFQFANFSEVYKNCISNLTKELRYLSEKGFLSFDDRSIVCTKTASLSPDPNCILESSLNYLPATVSGLAARDLYTVLNNSSSTIYTNYHRTEDFGIRYTIRTNGSEVIIIASNPNPYSVFNVDFNFNNSANPIIRNSTSMEMLFEDPLDNVVTDLNYKENRNWISRANFIANMGNTSVLDGLMRKYTIPYQSPTNKTISISFGPFDVHIMKFVGPSTSYSELWQRDWSNNGSGNIQYWGLSDIDKRISGDFNGDAASEILNIQSLDNLAWSSLIGYNETSGQLNTWLWCNNDWEGIGTISNWSIKSYDKYYSGDFNGDNKDELLCIQSLNQNGKAALLSYNQSTNHFNPWLWCNSEHEGLGVIKWWGISAADKYIIGDYNGDSKDELLCIQGQTLNNWAALIGYNQSTNLFDNWLWCNNDHEGLNAILWWTINSPDKYYSGDFNGDGMDELLCISAQDQNNWAALIGYNQSTNLFSSWLWCNNGSNTISTWTINSLDNYTVGDFNQDGKDDLMCIQDGTNGTHSKLFTFSNGSWSLIWQDSDNKIHDWPVSNSGGNDATYLTFNRKIDENEELPCLLAFREFGCNKYLSSLYHYNPSKTSYIDDNQSKNESTSSTEIIIYPNPTSSSLYLAIPFNNDCEVTFFNSFGSLVKRETIFDRVSQIDLSDLPDGIYYVKINFNQQTTTKKVVVAR